MGNSYWRINPVAIIGAAIALISVFLPWWGIYEVFESSVMLLARWPLWSSPASSALRRLGRAQPIPATSLSQTFTVSSLIVLVLALVVASLALAGGLTLIRKYLAAGLALSILTPVVYTGAIAYVTSNYCLTPLCVSGPIGSASLFGTTFTWGFETGFYLFIVAIFVLALSLILNRSLARPPMISQTQISVTTSQPAN